MLQKPVLRNIFWGNMGRETPCSQTDTVLFSAITFVLGNARPRGQFTDQTQEAYLIYYVHIYIYIYIYMQSICLQFDRCRRIRNSPN